jgi:hypothetical protein
MQALRRDVSGRNEYDAGTVLMAQLQVAEVDGPAAQQLLQLKNELARREEGLLEQKCRWGRGRGVYTAIWRGSGAVAAGRVHRK